MRILFLALLLPVHSLAAGVMLVSSGGSNQVLAYDATNGAYLKAFASGAGLQSPSGMALGLDGFLYVSSTGTDQVLRFDRNTGAFAGVFTTAVKRPSALAWGPDGNLYVGSFGEDIIYRCNGRTGVVMGGLGHATPALSFSNDGNLYVANTPNNAVDVFNPSSGALIRSMGQGAGLMVPSGITGGPDGTIYVSSNGDGRIWRFTPAGNTLPPIPSGPELAHPLALAFGLDGNLYVSTSQSEVLRYDPTGRFINRVVSPGSGGLQYPAAIAFLPDPLPATGPPTAMRIVTGDGQEAAVNTLFPLLLTVEVLSGDRPVPLQSVQFSVTTGSVFLTSPMALTDPAGRASTLAIARDFIGAVTVTATLGPFSAVFHLTTTPAPIPPPFIFPGGVLHSARRTPIGLTGAEIPRGGMIVIFGRGLGPVAGITGVAPYGTRLPDDPSGTSVRLTTMTDNTALDLPIVFASDAKVIAIVPSTAPAGPTLLSISYQNRQSNSAPANVANSNFGIYTRNELGNGPAVAFTVDDAGGRQPIGLGSPARAGQLVVLRGTGLGPVSTPDNAPSNTGFDLSDMGVLIGNIEVQALSAGRASDAAAIDEIQFRIPDDTSVPDGCYIPVAVRTATRLSNFATISKVAAGGAGGCDHPLKLPGDTLTRLDAGESIKAGVLGITRLSLDISPNPALFVANGGVFAKFDSNSLFVPGGLTTMTVAEGSCTVYQAPILFGSQALLPVPLATGLDAGTSMTLMSPDLRSQSLPRRSSGAYDRSTTSNDALLPKELRGTWTFSAQGGAEVNAFNAALELPPPLTWTNKDAVSEINRDADLTVQWETDGEARFDRVIVSGGMFRGSDLYGDGIYAQFACSAPFYNGTVTIPATILRQLPASSPADFITFVSVANAAFDAKSGTFSATASDGRALDAAATTYVIGMAREVTFR